METLPEEIENYILWLAAGPMDLDIYEKKKEISKEFELYRMWSGIVLPIRGVYLNPLLCYNKTPELEDIEYKFGSRYLLSDYGITKKQHNKFFLDRKSI